MTGYRLTYFDFDGLGEPIRLLFVLAKVPFEDRRIPCTPGQPVIIPAEIMQKSRYGQLPILEFDNVVLSQSSAIGRFLAKRFNLYGRNDVESAQIDEIIEALRDYGENFRTLRLARDDEAKDRAIKNIIEVSTPKYATQFGNILEESGSGYLIGQSPSYADLQVYHFIKQFNYQIPELTKNYPALEALVKRIGNISVIREWNLNKFKVSKYFFSLHFLFRSLILLHKSCIFIRFF